MSNNTGLKIKKIRTENAISQSILVRKAKLSQSFLSDIESGHKRT